MTLEPEIIEPKKSNLVSKTIKFSPRHLEMVDIITAENGHTSFSGVITTALMVYFKQTAPPYLRDRLLGKIGDPEVAAKQKVARDEATSEAKKDSIIRKKQPILDELEGTVKEIAGELMAIYYTHTFHSDDRQMLPLKHISEDLVANQWAPSRKAVEKFRLEKELKIVRRDGEELPE